MPNKKWICQHVKKEIHVWITMGWNHSKSTNGEKIGKIHIFQVNSSTKYMEATLTTKQIHAGHWWPWYLISQQNECRASTKCPQTQLQSRNWLDWWNLLQGHTLLEPPRSIYWNIHMPGYIKKQLHTSATGCGRLSASPLS